MLAALVLPLSAPVPEEYAKRFDAMKPSEYGNYEVATGPYMLKNDSAGKVLGIGYVPGKSATLVRNPNWNPATDFRPAYLDQIDIEIGGDPTVIGRQVLEGSDMVQNEAPAQSIVKLAYEKFRTQLEISPGAGDHYIAVDNKQGPFANVNVRKAFWAALDRTAMNKARGGELVTNVMTHFIYPEIPGFEQAGGLKGPQVDYNDYPEGNAAVAAKYMRLAGYPSGKYTGGKTLADRRLQRQPAHRRRRNRQPDAEEPRLQDEVHARRILGHVLEVLRHAGRIDRRLPERRLGRRLRRPPGGARRGVQRQEHRLDRQQQLGPGERPRNQQGDGQPPNWSSARRHARNAWAQIDRKLVAQAAAIPFDWDKQPNVESKDVAGVGDLWNTGQWDYSFTSLK